MYFSKLIVIFLLTLSVGSAKASKLSNFSIGLGTLTEQVDEFTQTNGGDEGTFEFTPYLKTSLRHAAFSFADFDTEFGFSLPRESRDSDVTRLNYWVNFMLSKSFNFEYAHFRAYFGFSLFNTRLSMDGSGQDLTNAGDAQTFQTPNGSSTATNLAPLFSLDIIEFNSLTFNSQILVFNPEDSIERTITYTLSINYNFGEQENNWW